MQLTKPTIIEFPLPYFYHSLLRLIERVVMILMMVTLPLQSQDKAMMISKDIFQNGFVTLSQMDSIWVKFSPGLGEPTFADPAYSDSSWYVLPEDIDKVEWNGIGWFRLRVTVDSTLKGKPLSFSFRHFGALEVYFDGELVKAFGEVSDLREVENPFPSPFSVVVLTLTGEHTLAIRYSNLNYREFKASWLGSLRNRNSVEFGNLDMVIAPINAVFIEWQVSFLTAVALSVSRISLYLTLGLLFLLLYLFYPRQRSSLYFGLYAFSLTINISAGFSQGLLMINFYLQEVHEIAAQLAIVMIALFFLVFLYKEFYETIPRYFWVYPAGFGISAIGFFLPSMAIFGTLLGIFLLASSVQCMVILYKASRAGRSDTWIISLGTFCHIVNMSRLGLEFIGYRIDSDTADWIRLLSSIGVLIAVTIYLARRFSQTNTDLEKKLIEVRDLSDKNLKQEVSQKLLEAENARKSVELESARELQLSMLPKLIPKPAQLDISVYMKTATEVGGDYYDFFEHSNGKLTAVIGDATGHGAKAGMMVMIAKSYFQSFAAEPDPIQIIKKMSTGIRSMNMRGLYMGMTIIKIDGLTITMSIAGMPPLMIYRSQTKTVERILLKAMPLGSVNDFPYENATISVMAGDTLLFMTDGLPELFSPERELLGYDRIESTFLEIGHHTAPDIVTHFTTLAESWAGRKTINDDITLMVMKAR